MARDTEKRLNDLLNSSHQSIRRAYLNAVRSVQDSMQLKQLQTLLENGNIEGLVELIESIPQRLSMQVNLEFAQAGNSTSNLIASVTSTPIVFDMASNRAVAIMQNERLRLIRQFTQGQRELVRDIMTEGITRQINPIEQARQFRDSIGLTSYQEKAVQNYKRALENRPSESLRRALRDGRFDRTVVNATQSGKAIPQKKINRMVQRYRERYLKYRAETIGRTEALRAVNHANEEAIDQAVDDGVLDKNEFWEEWSTSGDERVRTSHSTMNGQRVRRGESFISGAGNLLRFPGDPNAPAEETIDCRCLKLIRF